MLVVGGVDEGVVAVGCDAVGCDVPLGGRLLPGVQGVATVPVVEEPGIPAVAGLVVPGVVEGEV